jgi:GNAT superfamily N-acetyltransferase
VTIRAAVPADAAALAALSGELGYPAAEAEILERLARMGSTQQVLVYDDGSVLGWIEVVEALRLESGRFGEITGLVVREASRGRGIGAALVEAAAAWARERGLPKLRVRSNVTRERTHRFYLRLGFFENKRQVVFDRTRG